MRGGHFDARLWRLRREELGVTRVEVGIGSLGYDQRSGVVWRLGLLCPCCQLLKVLEESCKITHQSVERGFGVGSLGGVLVGGGKGCWTVIYSLRRMLVSI